MKPAYSNVASLRVLESDIGQDSKEGQVQSERSANPCRVMPKYIQDKTYSGTIEA